MVVFMKKFVKWLERLFPSTQSQERRFFLILLGAIGIIACLVTNDEFSLILLIIVIEQFLIVIITLIPRKYTYVLNVLRVIILLTMIFGLLIAVSMFISIVKSF